MSEEEPSRLQKAIDAGKAQGKLALYFGCLGGLGHYLHQPNGGTIWEAQQKIEGFPWSPALMDTGLLKNGKRRGAFAARCRSHDGRPSISGPV
jgi:hypothetical protein